MFWFNREGVDWKSDEAWKDLGKRRLELARKPLEEIVAVLSSFGQSFRPSEEAILKLMGESGFSRAEVLSTLAILPNLLSEESLMKRVRGEFGNATILDRFTKLPHAQALVKANPVGIILHVTAGNVFLSSIDSLITGLLTKNLSILKVSSRNTFFPEYFARELSAFDKNSVVADKFAILHWKGGDQETEAFVKKRVNAIVAWGGEEVMESYRRDLPAGVKFLDFGPKVSFQLVTKAGLQDKNLNVVAERIVADIVPWDQAACSSPQNLFVEAGVDRASLIAALELAFQKAGARGEISDDEATEILKEYYRGLYSELMEDGDVKKGRDYLLHAEKMSFLRPSPLNRSLVIKTFSSGTELFESLAPLSYYLQSCAYLLSDAEKASYLELMALAGVKRLAPLGTITWGMDGAPHDGRFVLRELVNFVGDERRSVDYGEAEIALESSDSLKAFFETSIHPRGYIFSSGGTTGEPKYVHFGYEEFDATTDLLAENFRAQGLRPGMTVANLFVAGNLWSSFLAAEKFLEKIGAIQLPIGGLCSQDNIVMYLKKFRPDAVLGIPSLLVSLAEYAESKGIELTIPRVYYAGEALSDLRRDYLSRVWKTTTFGSAGYASVDAGVIGYQCSSCGPGEHHVFSDLIDLKIVGEEAVVTSHLRTSMPVKNYRTGDRVEWISDCACGRKDKRFKLLGRVDNILQIWSCRLIVTDIEAALKEVAPEVLTYQITLSDFREHNLPKERLTISYEGDEVETEALLRSIYARSRDLQDTISFDEFRGNVAIEQKKIERNTRTGKISLVKDLRK